jgi:ribosomal-protein-alanine acetyltransferase
LSVRALESRDIETILAIQSACPEIAQWTAWDYERVTQGEMSGWVSANPTPGGDRVHGSENAEAAASANAANDRTSEIDGFLVARRVAADMEILNFAVRPDARRHGAGAALLKSALDWAQSFSAEQAILEVRSANQTALRFYERYKFQIVGRRRNYYADPTDDALLLTAGLT